MSTPIAKISPQSASRLLCALFSAVLMLSLSGPAAADKDDRKAKGNTRTSVNKNTNVNVNNNRNTNVNVNSNRHVDVDIDVDRGFHPVETMAKVAVTAAVIGAIVPNVPPSCVPVQIDNVLYQQCGSNWYQPQYVGSSVQYVVVVAPR